MIRSKSASLEPSTADTLAQHLRYQALGIPPLG